MIKKKTKKNSDEVVSDSEEMTNETETTEEKSELEIENEALKEEVVKLKNDYFKAYADAENIRKRQERDFELSMKYRIQTFADSILPALDNLERALASEVTEATQSYRDGVEMIYEQLMNALKQEGVTPIEALDKKFDPNVHQALQVEEVEGVKPDTIVEEYQKGYMIKDRVLRASLVKVSQ